MRTVLRNCCSPVARDLPMMRLENWQSNASRVHLQPLMQKRKYQWENFLQNSAAATLSRARKSWTSSQITTLNTSRALRQSGVFLNLYRATENCFARKYVRQNSQILTPRFVEDPQPSSLCGAVTFIKKVFHQFLKLNKSSLYFFICTCYKDFHKNFSTKFHYLYIFICIFTHAHLRNVIMTNFSAVSISRPRSWNVSRALGEGLQYFYQNARHHISADCFINSDVFKPDKISFISALRSLHFNTKYNH